MNKNVYVYNFTESKGLILKDIEYGIDPGVEDKVIIQFFSQIGDRKIIEKERKFKIYATNKGNYFNYKGRIYLSEFSKIEL